MASTVRALAFRSSVLSFAKDLFDRVEVRAVGWQEEEFGPGGTNGAAPKVHETINTLDGKCAEIFRGHPFYEAPSLRPVLRRLVESPDLKLTS